MRDVSSARVLPCSPSIDLGDDAQERHLGRSDVAVQRIGDADQSIVVQIGAREGPVHMFDRMGKPVTAQ